MQQRIICACSQSSNEYFGQISRAGKINSISLSDANPPGVKQRATLSEKPPVIRRETAVLIETSI